MTKNELIIIIISLILSIIVTPILNKKDTNPEREKTVFEYKTQSCNCYEEQENFQRIINNLSSHATIKPAVDENSLVSFLRKHNISYTPKASTPNCQLLIRYNPDKDSAPKVFCVYHGYSMQVSKPKPPSDKDDEQLPLFIANMSITFPCCLVFISTIYFWLFAIFLYKGKNKNG